MCFSRFIYSIFLPSSNPNSRLKHYFQPLPIFTTRDINSVPTFYKRLAWLGVRRCLPYRNPLLTLMRLITSIQDRYSPVFITHSTNINQALVLLGKVFITYHIYAFQANLANLYRNLHLTIYNTVLRASVSADQVFYIYKQTPKDRIFYLIKTLLLLTTLNFQVSKNRTSLY